MYEGDASIPQRNLWLSALSPKDYALIEPHLSRKDFGQGVVLYDAGQDVDHVFFPERGVISLLTVMEDGDAVETAAVGPEGLVGAACGPLANPSPTRAVVQAPGAVAQMDAGRFGAALKQSPSLRAALSRFTEALFAQVQQSAACNARHRLEERLARWLVTFHDRTDGDDLPITQEHLSEMLGVRRATVSDVGATLERRGLIRRARGRITVLDREGLEQAACECYGAVRGVMDAALGRVRRA
jgi:CRP-like cAMP-binding protein